MSTESYFLIKIIPVLHQSNIMYGLIGELISADNNLDKESIKTNKKRLQNIITALDIMKNYEDCDIPVSDVNKYLEMAIKSMSIFDNEK